jgi:hypothetical protein
MRQEVYARIKSIVTHHLRQSAQPEAIVELEKACPRIVGRYRSTRW